MPKPRSDWGDPHEYHPFADLIRDLKHELRASLSVISNDLYYLGGIAGEGQVAQSLERCRIVSACLGRTAAVVENVPRRHPVSLAEIAAALAARAPGAGISWTGEGRYRIDCDLLATACGIALELSPTAAERKIAIVARSESLPEDAHPRSGRGCLRGSLASFASFSAGARLNLRGPGELVVLPREQVEA